MMHSEVAAAVLARRQRQETVNERSAGENMAPGELGQGKLTLVC